MGEQPFSDKEIKAAVSRVIQTAPDMIFAFKPKFLTQEDWELAITAKPSLFAKCKSKPPSLCMLAVSLDGFNLNYVDPIDHDYDFYQDLCMTAISQNPKALAVVPKEFRTKKLLALAYANDPELLVSEKRLTPAMVESILEHNPGLIQYVVDPTDEMIIKALSLDPKCIVYFKTVSPKVRDYFEEYYPQYASMLIHD